MGRWFRGATTPTRSARRYQPGRATTLVYLPGSPRHGLERIPSIRTGLRAFSVDHAYNGRGFRTNSFHTGFAMSTASPPFVLTAPSVSFVPASLIPEDFRRELLAGHGGVALVDLTKPGMLSYAGVRDQKEFHVFSAVKVGIMFAAFRLRERVQAAWKANSATTGKDAGQKFFHQLTEDWKPIVSKKVAKTPHDFPNLSKIFDVDKADNGTIEFKDSNKSWDELKETARGGGVSKATVNGLGFLDRLKLGIAWSDDNASGSCLHDLGYQFINGTLANEGFFDGSKADGGLWLGSDYGFAPGAPKMGDDRAGTTVGATAQVLAKFITLMVQGRLVNKDSSIAMQDLMDFRLGSRGTRSFVDEGLRKFRKEGVAVIIRKIGMPLDDSTPNSEVAFVSRRVGMNWWTYAAVALNAPTLELHKIFNRLDDCIVANSAQTTP
jgi:hypothetical protein